MKNIIVITQWGYEEGLIQSYTLPYLKIVHAVYPVAAIYLITQEKTGLQQDKNKRRTIQKDLDRYNIVLVPETYHRAGFTKYMTTVLRFFKHLYLIFAKRIKYIHTFCTPAGGYGYILAKVTGRKLVIDSYEPHAEYMLECGVWKKEGFPFWVLNALEKKQAQEADYLIATTRTMIAHTEERFRIGVKHAYVKPACVDLERFQYDAEKAKQLRRELNIDGKVVCVYAGKFGDFYLKEEVFEFYQCAFEYWKERFHVLLLSDLAQEELYGYCNKFGLNKDTFTLMKAPHALVPLYLSAANFGLSPYRPSPSKRFCTPIKNGEYWALGLPVVITKDISVDSDLIDKNGIGYVLQSLDREEYLNAVKKIDALLKTDVAQLREKIRQIAINNRSFGIAENVYREIYN